MAKPDDVYEALMEAFVRELKKDGTPASLLAEARAFCDKNKLTSFTAGMGGKVEEIRSKIRKLPHVRDGENPAATG